MVVNLGFALPNHIATFRIGTTGLGIFGLWRLLGQFRFEGFLTLGFPITFNGVFQTNQVSRYLLLILFQVVLVLVGVRLEVGAVLSSTSSPTRQWPIG